MSQPTQKAYDELCAGYDTVMVSLQDAEAKLAECTQERNLAMHERNVAEADCNEAIDQLEALRSACQTLAEEMQEKGCAWGYYYCDGQIKHWAEQLTTLARVAPGAERTNDGHAAP